MPVIAVYSVKGGVGKTTLAVDLAWRCAQIGNFPTLLWDLDQQGGAGFLLGAPPRKTARAMSLFHRDSRPRDLIEPTRFDKLHLLQADESLRAMPVQLARIGARSRLSQMLSFLRADYRRIVLDCPPMLNEVSDQIIAAADIILLPLPPSPLSSRALDQVRSELMRNHKGHPPILPVLSMYDQRRKLHRELREGLARGWPVIPQSSHVEQMASRHEPLPAYANWTDASRAMGRLWSAVEMKLLELGHA